MPFILNPGWWDIIRNQQGFFCVSELYILSVLLSLSDWDCFQKKNSQNWESEHKIDRQGKVTPSQTSKISIKLTQYECTQYHWTGDLKMVKMIYFRLFVLYHNFLRFWKNISIKIFSGGKEKQRKCFRGMRIFEK